MITVTPTIIRVINESRREVVMAVEFSDDVSSDVRTVTGTGKTKTQAEGKGLLDNVKDRYLAELAHEALVIPIKAVLEADAKTYLEAELNG